MEYKFEINDLVITNRFDNAIGFIKEIDKWDDDTPYRVDYIEKQHTLGNYDWFCEEDLTLIKSNSSNEGITDYSVF